MSHTIYNDQITIFIDTLGCAKNCCDSSQMLKEINNAGFKISNTPLNADVIIINTCAFIVPAVKESIDTFFEYKNTYKNKKIIITGCIVSRYKNKLANLLPEADLFLSCKDEKDIVKNIEELFHTKKPSKNSCIKYHHNKEYAYVKISDGCNKHCSYCTIPFIRGKYKSSEYKEIEENIKEAIANGVKEIILVAQDCGVWGSDFADDRDLSWLLNKIATKFPNIWIRVLYIEPQAVNDKLINCFLSHENICNYFDIPMQHASEKIIKSMNRIGSGKQFLRLVKKIKKKIPDSCIRTTFIVGYPGETEEDFKYLCNFAQECPLDFIGIFKFYPEEGTKAATLNNQTPEEIKNVRFDILRDLCDIKATNKMKNLIGTSHKILIEGKDNGRYYGRNKYLAPDIDSIIYINNDKTLDINIGEIVKVKIIDSDFYDYIGKVI